MPSQETSDKTAPTDFKMADGGRMMCSWQKNEQMILIACKRSVHRFILKISRQMKFLAFDFVSELLEAATSPIVQGGDISRFFGRNEWQASLNVDKRLSLTIPMCLSRR